MNSTSGLPSPTITLPSRLSFSSLSTYAACGELWRLERGYKLGVSTWWASIGGSAVHECVETYLLAYEAEEPAPEADFEVVFERAEKEEKAKGLEIKPSGPKRNEMCFAGGPNKKDREWWLRYGPRMVEAALRWFHARVDEGWKLVAVEQGFDVTLGGVRMTGRIDLVMTDDQGEVRVVDLKTGNETPSKLQLATYREGLYEETFVDATWGAYLRFGIEDEEVEAPVLDEAGQPVLLKGGPNKGKPKTEKRKVEGEVYAYLAGHTDFTVLSKEYVEHQYLMLRRGIEAGNFIANPRNGCDHCPVKAHCRTVGGMKSGLIPVESVLLPPKTSDTPTSVAEATISDASL